jgi:pimeloyl-ACP methyl ester carboxylesterase
MMHGWMDVGASFQFVVDALQGDWHVIAPDWRGFGLSQRSGWIPTGSRTTWPTGRHPAPLFAGPGGQPAGP